MIITALAAAGFKPCLPEDPNSEKIPQGDYTLRDDSDGHGPYIWKWYSSTPCPFPALIREPYSLEAPKHEQDKRGADYLEIEANEKEREDMIKAAEIVRQSVAEVDRVNAACAEAIRVAEDRTRAALMLADAALKERDEAIASLAKERDEKQSVYAALDAAGIKLTAETKRGAAAKA